MSRSHIADALARLSAAFPSFALDDETIRVYADGLSDIAEGPLASAVNDAIRTSTWFPSVAGLRERALYHLRGQRPPDQVGGQCTVCSKIIAGVTVDRVPASYCEHSRVKTQRIITTRSCCGHQTEVEGCLLCMQCVQKVIESHGPQS